MTYELEFRPEARDELNSAYDWYEERRRGLGDQFLLAVEAAVGRIRRLPESYPVVYRDVRRALLDRFPFGIFYVLGDEQIVVLAVFHARRDRTPLVSVVECREAPMGR